MTCEKCKKNPASITAIIQGIVWRLCQDCRPLPKVNSGHARWQRSTDLEDHEHEVQQPYNADGTPNALFAKLYPKQARAVFSEEQLRKAE